MTPTVESKVQITCHKCGTTREMKPLKDGTARLPNGWRRFKGLIWCDSCWGASFVLRAITFPISGPVNITWPELNGRLHEAWKAATRCANWSVQQLLALDNMPRSNAVKLEKMPPVYLYGLHNDSGSPFSVVRASTRQCIFRDVEDKYRRRRFDVLLAGKASPPLYRYPYPLPINDRDWTVDFDSSERPQVHFLLGPDRVTLRLNRFNRHRQVAAVKQFLAGEADSGAAAIYRVRANPGDNRNGGSEKRVLYRYMCKLCLYLPRQAKRPADKEAAMTIGGDCFCRVRVDGYDRPWTLNADHVTGWIIEHNRRRQRLSEDLKFEKRWPERTRKRMLGKMDLICRNHANRMKTWTDSSTAMVANYCARHHCAVLRLESRDKSDFAWSGWIDILRRKLEDRHIDFRDATKPSASEEVVEGE